MRRVLILAILTLVLIPAIIACTQASVPEAITTPVPAETPEPTAIPETSNSPDPTAVHDPTTTTPQVIEPVQAIATGELEVHFIDVGQGDSILIDLGQTEVLIDGGGRSPGVVAYLENHIDGALEIMVATHPHADHIGGLIEVLAAFDVNEIWHNGDTATSKTFSEFISRVESEGAEIHVAKLHDVIEAGDLSLFVHHPASLEGSTNNNSIVLHLAFGEIDFLFTGDAEQEAEGQMMMLSSVKIPEVEILKVGHHGSKTASLSDFLSITSPEIAIYMAKEGNSYGHPHQETITALTNIGAKILGTDTSGTIVITSDGKQYSVVKER